MITISLIIIITCTSIIGMYDINFFLKLIFNRDKIKFRFQSYRYITYSFIHSNFIHLGINMCTLFVFGLIAEKQLGSKLFLCFFLMASIFSVIPYYRKNFNIVGCSGSTASIIYFCVLFHPVIFWISLFYLAYCYYADKYSKDSVAHLSHLWGSMFSILFVTYWKFELIFNIFVP